MATTKITNPELFDLGSLNTALKLPSGTTAERPTSPSTGEWRYNTTTNLIEFYDGGDWRDLQDEDIPPVNSEHFNTVTYTGTGGTQAITGVGFQPDWVWIKNRNDTNAHILQDTTRGAGKTLFSSSTSAEDGTSGDLIASFDSDGFTVNENFNGSTTNESTNKSGNTYVAWCWKLNEGTTSSNTDGSITSTVQANTRAGFSLIKYTGNGSASATVGHGLGSIPELTIFKQLDSGGTSGGFWNTYLTSANTVGFLNSSAAFVANTGGTNGSVDIAGMSSTTFGFLNGSSTVNNQNNSGSDYIVYAFTSVAGYSKIGTYTGNGSSNGPIVNTGFEPAMIIIKRTDSIEDWKIIDNKRGFANTLEPNESIAEETGNNSNFKALSNGFQIGDTSGDFNANGGTYLYIAFAADPGTAPVLADSFNTTLYTGNGGTQSITGLGFSPNLVWLKERGQAANHRWLDTLRGATNAISSSLSSAEFTDSTGLTSFETDGFTLGANVDYNNNGGTFVAWNWKANPIPTINTDGTIQSVVSANQAAGFSIVAYTGDGNTSSTVGHGLPSAPKLLINKSRGNGQGWAIVHEDLSTGYYLGFNTSAESNSLGNDGSITKGDVNATNFGFTSGASGVNGPNLNGNDYITYCFIDIAGFSKFGSYTGTGAAGNTVTIGFEPSWIMIKRSDSTGGWLIFDSKRNTSNPRNNRLEANNNSAEQTGSATKFVDFDATSFEPQISDSEINASGGTYVYAAFKENPTPQPLSGYMSFLVVAGGGAGGRDSNSGGGGAGGLRTSYGSTSGGGSTSESDIALYAGTYTITVGAGGPDNTTYLTNGQNGADSSIAASGLSTITSLGGGGGAGQVGTPNGTAGGSGGGGSYSSSGGAGTANQGFAGGAGVASGSYPGGGGGGASEAGNTNAQGHGGDGLAVEITGASVTYAGGGGAGRSSGSGTAYPGGAGGGGTGTACATSNTAGSANTGGGGGGYAGGGCTSVGKAGGSGVVILRLATSEYSGTTTGSPTVTTNGDYTILTYTGSGTYVHS